MRVIIYGIGKAYSNFFSNIDFVKILQNKIEVIGFVDRNINLLGKEITFHNQKFNVKSIEDIQKDIIDKIIITTKLYFYEIQSELIKKGYKKDQIVLLDWILNDYYNKIIHLSEFEGKDGIEIGGPSKLFADIYEKCLSCDNVCFSSNTVWLQDETGIFRYEDKELGKMWIAEATDMHLIDNESYDFLLSSNNLEHIANPLKALKEFTRLIRAGGTVLVLVPIKEKTFDHNREYTPFEHILEDYEKNVGEDDLSHLPEIIKKHDYDMDIACGGREKFIQRAKRNLENRCLHHHVFEESCLRKLFEFSGLEVFDFNTIMHNWAIIGRKVGKDKESGR